MKPGISIVVPAYNCEKYIAACLESIMVQTFRDYEVLVVDDGSTDHTEDILDEFAKTDRRIRLFRQENAGPSAARNTGIRNAAGEYIMFCDADDTITPHTCEALYSEAEKTSAQLALAGHMAEIIQDGDSVCLKEYYPLCCDTCIISGEELRNQISKRFEYGIAHSVCGKLFRRECLEKNHILFDETIDIGEDLLFNLSYLPYVERCSWVNRCLYHYYYRSASGSLATRVQKDTFCKKVRLYHEAIRFFEAYHTDDLGSARHMMNRRLFLEAKECIKGTVKQNDSFRNVIRQLKRILENSTLQAALTEIQSSIGEELGLKNVLICRMMQKRLVNCVYLLFYLF